MTDLLAWLCNPGFPYTTAGCEDAMVNAAAKLSEELPDNNVASFWQSLAQQNR